MRVRLRELKPNPMRDFGVDPLDEAIINRLRSSISEHGFWGGVVGRQVNGHVEIGAGHHRIEAAILEGVEEGEVYVVTGLDDRAMIRIYAEENATQRGAANSTARAGSVAAALRMAAYEVLTDTFAATAAKVSDISKGSAEGNIASGRGIGWSIILRYLDGVPGINKGTVIRDLASLKKSGEYARIVAEVRDRIAAEREFAEQQAASLRDAGDVCGDPNCGQANIAEAERWEAEAEKFEAAQERAEKAAAKAAEEETTFDYRGVAPILKVSHHLDSFRDVVTSEAIRPYLPIDQQAVIAARVVALAEETEQELTGLFIRNSVGEAIAQVRGNQQSLTANERERLLAADWSQRLADLQEHYLGALRGVAYYGEKLAEHLETKPEGQLLSVRSSYGPCLRAAQAMIKRIEEELG